MDILFLHGALGTAKDLIPLMELLQKEGHQTHAFDFSGHGKSSAWPEEFRIDYFARELDAYLKARKLDDVVIVGHSMGGYVALYHKAHFEDSPISKIFCYGTKFNWSEQAVAKELPMLDPSHLSENFPNFVQMLMDKHGERWKSLLRSTAHMMQNLEKLDGLTKEDLEEVQIPVYLLLGDQDRAVSTEETHAAKDHLPRAEIKTISHSKHDLERTNLKEIAQIVQELIS